MGDLGISDLHGDCRQPRSDVADPVVTAHHPLCSLRGHLELVRGIAQVMDNNDAGFRSHDGNLSYSPLVRLWFLVQKLDR